MGSYIITAPDGKKYRVSGRGTKEDALRHLQQQLGVDEPAQQAISVAQQPSMGGTLSDTGKSLGSGILEGISGAVTFPAAAGQWLGEKASGGIDRLMGYSEDDIAARRAAAERAQAAIGESQLGQFFPGGIGPQEVIPRVAKAMGSDYQPETETGEYAKTVGAFLPATVAGPGSLMKKAAASASAGLGSEFAGQQTEGTEAEPYARLAGAIIGGGLPGAVSPNPIKEMQKAAPSHAAVRNKKTALYDKLERAGVKYDAYSYGQWAQDIQNRIKINPRLHPRAAAIMDEIQKHVGKSPDFTDMEWLRIQAGQATRANAMTDAADIAIAGKLLGEIDNFTKGSPLISNGSIPASDVARTAAQARELARRNILAREIREMDRRSQYYASGSESGQRNQFASYLKSPKGRTLTPAEEKAFSRVVRREGLENVMHNAGSRLFNIGAMLSGASSPVTGIAGLLGAAGAVAANLGARKLSEAATNRKVSKTLKTVLAGRGAQARAEQAAKQLSAERKAALTRSLVGGLLTLPR